MFIKKGSTVALIAAFLLMKALFIIFYGDETNAAEKDDGQMNCDQITDKNTCMRAGAQCRADGVFKGDCCRWDAASENCGAASNATPTPSQRLQSMPI